MTFTFASAIPLKNIPRKSNNFIFLNFGFDSSFGAIGWRVIKWSDIEFEDEVAAFSLFEIIFIGIICVWKMAYPWIAAPDHSPPVIASGWCKNVIVLGMDTMECEMKVFEFENFRFNGENIFDERAAREIAIHRNFKNVPPYALEIPDIIVSFVKEIKPVLAFDPADTDFNIEVFSIFFDFERFGIIEKVGAVCVISSDLIPVRWVAVYTRYLVVRELIDFEKHVRSFESGCAY